MGFFSILDDRHSYTPTVLAAPIWKAAAVSLQGSSDRMHPIVGHSLSLRPESSCRDSKVCRETYPYDKRECTARETMAARENESCVYFIWCILFGRPHTSRYSNALEWTNSIRSLRGGFAAGRRQAMSEPPNPFWNRHSFSSVIRMTSLLLWHPWMQVPFEIHWQYFSIHVIRRSFVVQGLGI